MAQRQFRYSVSLTPTAPFHFDTTFFKPDHFSTGDHHWQPGLRWQTWYWQGQSLGLKITNRGQVDQPALQVDVYSAAALEDNFLASLLAEIRYRYNLDLDLNGFYAAFSADKLLAPIIERLRGMRPGHPSSLYEYLIIGIVLQNATVRRSIQMFQTLIEHYGALIAFADRQLWCFWPPGGLLAVPEAELRVLKVGYRAKSIKRIDDAFAAGDIDEATLRQADFATQKQTLLKLYGVGPATVSYLLYDVFHRYDFFDHISPWEQKIYSKLFFDRDPEDPTPVEELLRFFDRYGEYRQLAVHYLWEDLWWRHWRDPIPWLQKLIRT